MPAEEMLRIRLTKAEKDELAERARVRRVTLSEAVRQDLHFGDGAAPSPGERFAALRGRLQEELSSSGLPELSEEEIVAYCAAVRRERAEEATRAYA